MNEGFGANPKLASISRFARMGRVERVRGLIIESQGPRAAHGELCTLESDGRKWLAEVVGFNGTTTILMPLEDVQGLTPHATVRATGEPLTVALSPSLRGRVLNGLGLPMDGGPAIAAHERRPLLSEPPHPLRRNRVTSPLSVGVRAIDGLLTIGQGQRIGIFAGSGVGKSVLLGMMARYTEADVVVVGLVGERGREVREFIEKYLGPAGLKKTVVISETSDRWPILRIKAALVATTVAEYFRDQGLKVLFVMDSVTRVAHAMREVGLSLGEPPATRGYPPTVFATLPKLLERAGNSETGSITGIYTVLVDGDDHNEPVADTVRSILDGHLVLSRGLAAKNQYPAIDVLKSVSRVMPDIARPEQMSATHKLREWLAAYAEVEDLIAVGAYVRGGSKITDESIDRMPRIIEYLRQPPDQPAGYAASLAALQQLAKIG
ncbi:FliI/YscN family ATPase [candidate division KSB1 bacterium]|nr:FliI/YscN family ATPase [candidate division KSB1 bacterium]